MSEQPKEFVTRADPETIAACIAEALEEEGLVIIPLSLLTEDQRKQVRRLRVNNGKNPSQD